MRKTFNSSKILFLAVFLLFLSSRQDLLAQPAFRWAKSIVEIAQTGGTSIGLGITEDNNGNVITTGVFIGTYDFDPGPAVVSANAVSQRSSYVQKLDDNGNFVWVRTFGNNAFTVQSNGIAVDNNNDLYITGEFEGTLVLGGGVPNLISTGSSNVFVIKLNGTTGNVMWARNIGLGGDDAGNSITFNQFNNEIIFTGSFATVQNPPVRADIVVSSLNSTTGVDSWVKTFGSIHDDIGNEVTSDALGNIFVAGTYRAAFFEKNAATAIPTGPQLLTPAVNNRNNTFVLRLNSLGNVVWAKSFNKLAQGGGAVIGNSIAVDNAQNTYITGQFSGRADFNPGAPNTNTQGNSDVFIVSLNDLGTYRWHRVANSNGFDRGETIAIDQQGGVIVGGTFTNATNLVPGGLFIGRYLAATGTQDWMHTGGDGTVNALITGECDEIYATGEFISSTFAPVDLDPSESVVFTPTMAGFSFNAFILAWGSNATNVALNSPIVCDGESVLLSANTNGVNFTQYDWTIVDNIGAIQSNQITATNNLNLFANSISSAGSPYSVTLTASNGNGCPSTGTTQIIVHPNPTVALVPSTTTLCANGPQNVTIDANITTSTLAPYLYDWTWNGNSFSDGTNATTSTLSTGISNTTTFNVNITDDNGCSTVATTQIMVNPSPVVTVTPLTSTFCGNGPHNVTLGVNIASPGTAGPYDYNWSWLVNGNVISNADNNNNTLMSGLNTNITTTTVFNVDVVDDNGCSTQASTTITVNPAPTVVITGSQAVCQGTSPVYTATNIPGATYVWSNGDLTQSTTINNIQTDRILTVTVTDPNGCVTTSQISITVNQAPPVAITGDLNVCQGASPVYTATNILGATYVWNNGDLTQSTTINNIQNDRILAVTVTSPDGCVSTEQVNITVNPPLVVAIRRPIIACVGDDLNFGVLVSSTPNNLIYQWINNNSMTPLATYSNIPAGPLTVSVIVTDVITGCVGTDQVTINVNNPPTVALASPINGVCQNDAPQQISVTATPTGGQAPYTYAWTTNGQVNPNTTNTLMDNFNLTTGYNVIVRDANGCTAADQLNIPLNPTPNVAITPSATLPVCLDDQLTLTATPQNLNVVWNVPGNNPLTVPTNQVGTTNYAVVATDGNGCIGEANTDVEVIQCCFAENNPNYFQIGPDATVSDLAQYGIIRMNAIIYRIVDGNYHVFPPRVYVDENITLQVERGSVLDITNCDMVFGEGAGIVVTNNCKLIANNAVLRPCDDTKTWDGVRMLTLNGAPVDVDFHECTFINATVALWFNTGDPSESSIADNSFKNCKHGIVATTAALSQGITNNIFRIDDAATNLDYTVLTDVNNAVLTVFQRGNLAGTNGFQGVNNLYNTFYSGIQLMVTPNISGAFRNEEIISKNEFVNARNFQDTSNRGFTGIISSFRNGLNISDNSFTNLSRSIISHVNKDITIENNYIETTRRSTTDESTYQIIARGSGFSLPLPRVLIHNNTLVNSADPDDVTTFNTTNTELIEASGAIYLERFWTSTQVSENNIQGFEVGIYTHRSVSRITNNTIQSHICGIYMSTPFTNVTGGAAGTIFNTVSCNHIDMYRDLTPNHITEGWPIGLFVLNPPTRQVAGGRSGGFVIQGNCISNTRNAIWFENQDAAAARFENLYNNYLYNYEQSGLRFDGNFGSSRLFVPAGGSAAITAFPFASGRNGFIGNGDPSISTFSDIFINSTNPTAQTLNFDFNDFGLNGTAKLSLVGNVQPVASSNTRKQTVSVCANNDVQDIAQAEFDRMAVCDDEDILNFLPVLQRLLPNNNTGLANDYLFQLDQLSKEYGNEVATLVEESIEGLTNNADATILYQATSQLNLEGNAAYWMDYAYQKRMQNYTAAAATLTMIDTDQGQETLARVIVETAQMNLLINNTTVVSDQADIDALKTVGEGYGSYMNAARELLDASIGGYTFKHRPVILPLNKVKGAKPVDFADNGSFAIYPNPTNSQLFVDFKVDQLAQWSDIKIYDLHGRVLRQEAVNANKMVFDVSEFSAGTYVITLIDAEGKVLTEKFIKQ